MRLYQAKNFSLLKETINNMKRQPKEWRKIFVKHKGSIKNYIQNR